MWRPSNLHFQEARGASVDLAPMQPSSEFGDPQVTTTLSNRLTHYCHTVETGNVSYSSQLERLDKVTLRHADIVKKCLLFLHFCLVFSYVTIANAASFDCHKAAAPIELTICSDQKLSRNDEELAAAYRDALASTHGAWRADLVRQQIKWLAWLIQTYQDQVQSSKSQSELKSWLSEMQVRMITTLRGVPERGKIVFLQKTAEATDICSATLQRSNITWSGRDIRGFDEFEIILPERFIRPDWRSPSLVYSDQPNYYQAKFDFLNANVIENILLINQNWAHGEEHFYLVVAPDEEAIIEKGLQN